MLSVSDSILSNLCRGRRGGVKFLLNKKEENGNHSVVALVENVFDSEFQKSWFDHLQTMEFYGGKTSFGDVPREQMWVYDGGGNFGERANWTDLDNPRWIARPYCSELLRIQESVQKYFDDVFGVVDIGGVNGGAIFDSILLNKYRGFGDSIKPHRDSEEIFGDNPSVAILSLGCPREIIFQRILYNKDNLNSVKRDRAYDGGGNINGNGTFKVMLPSGSILFMGGELQKYYSHEIKKVKVIEDLILDAGSRRLLLGGNIRYSLTFRQYAK